MVKTGLVGIEIERGAALVKALDDAKIKIRVAMWAYLSDYEDWRMVLAGPGLDAGRDAYGLVVEAMAKAGFTPETSPVYVIYRMKHKFIRELRRIFAKARSVEGMRLGGQLIGDKFIEDAYVYRIS